MSIETPFRVGIGYDFHSFKKGRRLLLGGVEIPHDHGLKGHSDADVLLHSVADALLGATGLKDIGAYFPDSDPQYKDLSSLLILEKVVRLLRGKGFLVGNVDVTVLAEEPRIQPHIESIKGNLARALHVGTDRIGIKATTMEGHGPIGRREGIAAQTVVLLVQDWDKVEHNTL